MTRLPTISSLVLIASSTVMPERYISAKKLAKRARMIFCRIGPMHRQAQLERSRTSSALAGLVRTSKRCRDRDDDRQRRAARTSSSTKKFGQRDQDPGLQRQLQAHGLESVDHLRHQVDQQEDHHASDHDQHDEPDRSAACLVWDASSSCHLRRLAEVLEHLGQLPGLLAGADQADEHVVEDVRDSRPCACDSVLPPSMSSSTAVSTSRKRGFSTRVAQVAQALDDRHAGA